MLRHCCGACNYGISGWANAGSYWPIAGRGKTLTGVRPFYVAHAMMAFAAAGRTAAARAMLQYVAARRDERRLVVVFGGCTYGAALQGAARLRSR